jgi:hypothetical protein
MYCKSIVDEELLSQKDRIMKFKLPYEGYLTGFNIGMSLAEGTCLRISDLPGFRRQGHTLNVDIGCSCDNKDPCVRIVDEDGYYGNKVLLSGMYKEGEMVVLGDEGDHEDADRLSIIFCDDAHDYMIHAALGVRNWPLKITETKAL